MSTDFFGDLERQLVTATRERPRRLRRARARRAAAGTVTAAALAGAAALVITVASRPHDDVRAPATPATHRGEPLPSPAVLRGIRVALVGDPVALGLRGGLADALTREGVHVASVRSSVPQRATRVYFAPGHDRDAAGVAIVLHARGLTPAYAPVRPMTPAMRREAGGAGVLLIAGAERIAVLNATTIPGLGRATALRLQARGLTTGTVDNAARRSTRTEVQYDPGYRALALDAARALEVPTGRVGPMHTLTKLRAGQDAGVVVLVGTNRSTP